MDHKPRLSIYLVLITRTDPDLPLAILRVRDELIEINTTDVRFNQESPEAWFKRAAKQGGRNRVAVTDLLTT